LPDWRINCFFIGRAHRRGGVAAVARDGALSLIATAGGGAVEACPKADEGPKTAAAFLFGGMLGLFQRVGFDTVRKIGLHRWVVRRHVPRAMAT